MPVEGQRLFGAKGQGTEDVDGCASDFVMFAPMLWFLSFQALFREEGKDALSDKLAEIAEKGVNLTWCCEGGVAAVVPEGNGPGPDDSQVQVVAESARSVLCATSDDLVVLHCSAHDGRDGVYNSTEWMNKVCCSYSLLWKVVALLMTLLLSLFLSILLSPPLSSSLSSSLLSLLQFNILGKLRQECAGLLQQHGVELRHPDILDFLWIVNFPLFIPAESGPEGTPAVCIQPLRAHNSRPHDMFTFSFVRQTSSLYQL